MSKSTSAFLAALIALAPTAAFAGGIESKVNSKWEKGSIDSITNVQKAAAYQESFQLSKDQINAYAASQESNSNFIDINGDDFVATAGAAQSSSSSNQSASSDSFEASGFVVAGVVIIPPVAVAGVGGAVDVETESTDSSSSSSQQAVGAGLAVDGELTLTTGSTSSQMSLVGAETISMDQSASEIGLKTETSLTTESYDYNSHTNTSSGKSLF